jgi:hypothetical protein
MCGIVGLLLADEDENVSEKEMMHVKAVSEFYKEKG